MSRFTINTGEMRKVQIARVLTQAPKFWYPWKILRSSMAKSRFWTGLAGRWRPVKTGIFLDPMVAVKPPCWILSPEIIPRPTPTKSICSANGEEPGKVSGTLKGRTGFVSSELQIRYRKPITAFEVVLSGIFDSVGLYRDYSTEQKETAEQWLEVLGTAEKSDRYGCRQVCWKLCQ